MYLLFFFFYSDACPRGTVDGAGLALQRPCRNLYGGVAVKRDRMSRAYRPKNKTGTEANSEKWYIVTVLLVRVVCYWALALKHEFNCFAEKEKGRTTTTSTTKKVIFTRSPSETLYENLREHCVRPKQLALFSRRYDSQNRICVSLNSKWILLFSRNLCVT